jgi:probable F420-dependent oxidoreductase
MSRSGACSGPPKDDRVLKFGLSLPIVQQIPGGVEPWECAAGAPELVAVARAADRLGFSHLSACDHIAIPQAWAPSAGTVWYDAVVTLAFLAAVTTRIRLLSHVIVLAYRHPLVVAKAFASLDALSDGRVILGVGSGHLKPEFRALGANYEARGAFADEAVRAIRTAWEQERATFDGRLVQFRDVTIAPRPRQRPRPPIWVGGNSRAAVRRAARHADGWIPWLIAPAEFGRLGADARELRERAPDAAPFELVAPLSVGVDEGPATIAARVEEWLAVGATAFHVGLAHTGLDHLLERMALVAEAMKALSR